MAVGINKHIIKLMLSLSPKVKRLLGDIVNEESLAEINCHYIMA